MQVSARLETIQMSEIRKMFELAGENAIHLGLGEPDFQPPEHIIEGVIGAIKAGHNKYASTFGITPLRRAIAEDYSKYREGLDHNHVIVTASATEALTITLNTILNPGDEVLTPNPGFVLYASQIKLAGGVPVYYTLTDQNNFLPDMEEIEKLITPRTKAIIINSPSNPTGSVIPRSLLREIGAICDERDIALISDEVYDRIIYGGDYASSIGVCDNTVVINSFSKTLAMTGWRLGYIVTPYAEFIKSLSIVHYYNIACPPTPTQYGALAAYENRAETERFLSNMVSTFRKRRANIVKRLKEVDIMEVMEPEGAFYVYPKYDSKAMSIDARNLAMKLAEAGVICSPGTAFGPAGESHLRFSFAASDTMIEKGMDIVAGVINDLIS